MYVFAGFIEEQILKKEDAWNLACTAVISFLRAQEVCQCVSLRHMGKQTLKLYRLSGINVALLASMAIVFMH